MTYQYNKDEIKQNLTIENIEELLTDFDAAPERRNGIIVARTVCHNKCGCGSHKLYYYPNTTLFKCYTDCGDTWDVFELTRKVLSREHPKDREDSDWNLPEAIDYIARKFGYSPNQISFDEFNLETAEDQKIFDRYDRIKDINIKTQEVELQEYDDKILKHLPHPLILPWVDDGISREIMEQYEICYDPKNCGIVIPHRDMNGKLVGIRERGLIQENIERYGKYRPANLAGTMYNHPLSFNLYGLYQNKDNIARIKKAFVFESEKAVLQYATMFGQENNIAVGVCGSSFINYQFWLLMKLGVQEIIIGLDKQFQELGDSEFKKLTRNLKGIHQKYGNYVTLSILWDKGQLLDYKASPTDKGRDIFEELYKRRINLYV